jgi:hypothetical protein
MKWTPTISPSFNAVTIDTFKQIHTVFRPFLWHLSHFGRMQCIRGFMKHTHAKGWIHENIEIFD